MKAEQQYIDLFTQYEDLICRKSVSVLNALRAEAFAHFECFHYYFQLKLQNFAKFLY